MKVGDVVKVDVKYGTHGWIDENNSVWLETEETLLFVAVASSTLGKFLSKHGLVEALMQDMLSEE